MKPIIAFGLIMLSFTGFSQNNYFIADTSKSWSHVAAGVGSCGVLGPAHTYHIHFGGDSILFGNRYLKVFQSTDSLYTDDELIGLLYEDTTNRQVFYRDIYYGYEGLIYDFSIEEGDSICIENWYYGSEALLECDFIDSVLIDNEFVRKYFMREPWDDDIEDTWIEGIGSLLGVLNSGIYSSGFSGGFRDFLCYKYNDELIYSNEIYNSCHLDAFQPQILSQYYDTAYLNTPYTFQLQLSDTTSIDSVGWVVCDIPDDFTFNLETGTIEGFPTSTGCFGCFIAVSIGYNLTDKLDNCITVIDPTGIDSPEIENFISIAPNPCTEKVYIKTYFRKEILLNFSIYDVNGRKVLEKSGKQPDRLEINCTGFSKGVYFVRVEDLKGRFLSGKKFVKI